MLNQIMFLPIFDPRAINSAYNSAKEEALHPKLSRFVLLQKIATGKHIKVAVYAIYPQFLELSIQYAAKNDGNNSFQYIFPVIVQHAASGLFNVKSFLMEKPRES
mmetsp:Transcript_22132/g.35978  ORF Transcript_22132/g.35978 Transcript_22132/m.35978 type:complete len:105 (+) Transcript_22132:435-749(+)